MQLKRTMALAAATAVSAQRPEDMSICDYYTTALLTNNTAENQYTVLNLLVNTVVIGNYTQPNVGVSVAGILAKGTYNNVEVNLLPYFDGTLASSNRGGDTGVSVNFLDGGGATPLLANMPADSDTSNQHFLLTHLYAFFGSLLGCTHYAMPGFPAYDGHASMYDVHRFMDLDENELGYFIAQVGGAASSFGVADADVAAVAKALEGLFGMRCAPPATAIAAQGPQLQSICVAESCPLAEGAVCDQYEDEMAPSAAASSSAGANATATTTGMSASNTSATATGTAASSGTGTSVTAGGNVGAVVHLGAGALGLAAALLL